MQSFWAYQNQDLTDKWNFEDDEDYRTGSEDMSEGNDSWIFGEKYIILQYKESKENRELEVSVHEKGGKLIVAHMMCGPGWKEGMCWKFESDEFQWFLDICTETEESFGAILNIRELCLNQHSAKCVFSFYRD